MTFLRCPPPIFKKALHCSLDEEDITITSGGVEISLEAIVFNLLRSVEKN